MKKIDTFKLKDGREVSIVEPAMDGVQAITDFVNKLSREDTFLTFSGEKYTLEMETNWLENALNEIKFDKNYILWAVYDGKIIGDVSIKKGGSRNPHVGTIGLMIDADFRRQGLGRYLLISILKIAKQKKYQIAKLLVFDDNVAGKRLYEKMGFIECGRIPRGLYRQKKYSDDVTMYKNL